MQNYDLRVCHEDDWPALSGLFELVFHQPRTIAEWQWKFGASRQLLGDGLLPAQSFVALDERGQIVAHAGAVTLPGWFRGRSIPFVQVCDVMVHPEHRGGLGQRNLFTLLLRASLQRVAEDLPGAFRYGFPGRGPYLVGERARVYERIEVAIETEVPVCPPRLPFWRVAPLELGDPRLDTRWLRARHDLCLSLVRDGDYLRWRYRDNPTADYRLTGVWFVGRLVGWVVSRRQGGRLLVVDFLLPPFAFSRGVRAAVAHVAATESGLAGVCIWAPETLRRRLGPSGRQTEAVTANMSWMSSVETREARDGLFYTMGDVDIF